MSILNHTDFAALSVKSLQALAGFLSGGNPPARAESKAAAATRVCKLLALESDVPTVVGNMPSFLRTRRFAADAALLESALADANPAPAPAPVVAAPAPAPAPVVAAPAPVVAAPAPVVAAPAPVVAAPAPAPAPAMSAIDAWHARVAAACAAARTRKAAVAVAVAVAAPKPAGQYALPKAGTKIRLVFDLMSRPQGATNAEICAAVGIQCSWAVDGRRFAARHGLSFSGPIRDGRGVRFYLSPLDGADAAAPAADTTAA